MALRELSERETEELLSEQRIVRVAFDAVGERYLVPLGYVWFEGFLCAVTTDGRKTRIARDNPQVSFQLDDSVETGLFSWKSVSGEGTFELVTDPADIDRISPVLFGRFPDIPEWAREEYADKQASGQLVWVRIRPTRMTGRASAGLKST
jgi:nitroimidazol reductase NimA-like FMN-containing flavoprotein (pyridoxamine 5'-phosphate oxidase superfamily)